MMKVIAWHAGTPPRPAKSPRQKRYSSEDTVGVKSKLYSIMKTASQPLSSAEIWESAEVSQVCLLTTMERIYTTKLGRVYTADPDILTSV